MCTDVKKDGPGITTLPGSSAFKAGVEVLSTTDVVPSPSVSGDACKSAPPILSAVTSSVSSGLCSPKVLASEQINADKIL